MLTARNTIIFAVVVAVACLLNILYHSTRPPDSGGRGADSYGTHGDGYRGLFEVLGAVNVPVRRSLVPPVGLLGQDVTLAMIDPDARLVDNERDYIVQIRRWIEAGGTLVLAYRGPARDEEDRRARSRRVGEEVESTTETALLTLLGLPGVAIQDLDATTTVADEVNKPPATSQESRPRVSEAVDELFTRSAPVASHTEKAEPVGSWAAWAADLHELEVPDKALHVIRDDEHRAVGQILIHDDATTGSSVLAALFRLGDGQLLVLAEPRLLDNHLIRRADNAILGVYLLAQVRRSVVFDEFFHGLNVRGNPFWLVTRRPYNLVAVMVVFATLVWVWRAMIRLGPPAPDPLPGRRSIREYIEAMGSLFLRSRHYAFLLAEFRDGALWEMQKRLHLPASRPDAARIADAMARQDPDAARQWGRTMGEIEQLLKGTRAVSRLALLQCTQKVIQCQSKISTKPFAAKSAR